MRTSDDKSNTNKSEISARSITIQKTNTRSKEHLKKCIKHRLSKLKKSDTDFQAKATVVTIQEILLWEFGEDIINHPDFNLLSLSVTNQVAKNHELTAYLQQFTTEDK